LGKDDYVIIRPSLLEIIGHPVLDEIIDIIDNEDNNEDEGYDDDDENPTEDDEPIIITVNPRTTTPKITIPETTPRTTLPKVTPKTTNENGYQVITRGVNGKVVPNDPIVEKGKNITLSFVPDDNCEIEEIFVDGKTIGNVSNYTLKNVRTTHTVIAKFKVVERIEVWYNASDWAIEELKEASRKNVIPSKLFNRDYTNKITRQEFAHVAVRLYENISGNTVRNEAMPYNPFTDIDDIEVMWAYQLGITNGTSETTFTPYAEITREQMATMLVRALEKAGVNTYVNIDTVPRFRDDAEMHDWGRQAIYFMSKDEVIKGVGDNTFNVLGDAKIEEALLISLRSVNFYE
jgi:hypothetical protein